MKPQTAAMLLDLIDWQELPREQALRDAAKDRIFSDYVALESNVKIDLFNLLRFPKSNILLCARHLARLKNRNHRWPLLAPEDVGVNEKAIKLIATEYNLGPTQTPEADALPTAYGGKVYTLIASPFLIPFFGFQLLPPSITWNPAHSGNFNAGARTAADIDSIVLHTIEGTDTAGILWFQDPAANVSAHFVVSKEGDITQMVDVKDVASTSNYYNNRSISIECEGFANQANTWTPSLLDSLSYLCAWLCQEYGIVPTHPEGAATGDADPFDSPGIVGHYQIHGYAPFNKNDPGPHFDWSSFMTSVQDRILSLD